MEVEPEPRGLKLYAKIPKAVTLADLADALLKLDRVKLFEMSLESDEGHVTLLAQAEKHRENLITLQELAVTASNNEVYQVPISLEPFPKSDEHMPAWHYSRSKHVKMLVELILNASKIAVVVGDDAITSKHPCWSDKFSLSKIGEGASRPDIQSEFWLGQTAIYEKMQNLEKTDVHKFLTYLEAVSKLGVVVNQSPNIDLTGTVTSTQVLNLAGTNAEATCVNCGAKQDRSLIEKELAEGKYAYPSCTACGGPVRPSSLLFGEEIKSEVLENALELLKGNNLVLMIGLKQTKLLPEKIKKAGGTFVVLIQDSHTLFEDSLDLKLQYPVAEICKEVQETLSKTLQPQPRENKVTLARRRVSMSVQPDGQPNPLLPQHLQQQQQLDKTTEKEESS